MLASNGASVAHLCQYKLSFSFGSIVENLPSFNQPSTPSARLPTQIELQMSTFCRPWKEQKKHRTVLWGKTCNSLSHAIE